MDAMQAVTIGAAAVGAVLGIVNTVWALYRDRVRLKVAAVWMTRRGKIVGSESIIAVVTEHPIPSVGKESGLFGIRVTNLGFVEVTVDSVGLTSSGTLRRHIASRRRLSPIVSDAMCNVTLPVRLAPRSSATVWASLEGDELGRVLATATRVYCNTACGLGIYGTSRLLRLLVLRERASH